ncbi:MAG: tRNA (guanosine(37)-N1)-methyltransferase TrmD [Alphaproteobacteria bacterium RIFCSPHIGHO2_02_FULL_46_13]|nr:MAG: tRNA (guanosine(37)-N1)-methyltransferase TrmD [Alphaproteobacteria bacterium RIFCSPHIGHO2_02_FULL_46_13]
MHFNILTLFPELFPGPLGHSVTGRALGQNIWSFTATNIRDYAALNKHKTVDDVPFGGGAGMVMKPDVIERAVSSLPDAGRKIYLSPRGRVLNQNLVKELAKEPVITLLCGRYEGVDQRVLDSEGFEEISIGDYVLTGGEMAAHILMDACIRLLDGAVGNADTPIEESFSDGLLEYPHYTRPALWTDKNGVERPVPEILTSGHHANVAKWRHEQSLELTKARRPDLLKNNS